MYNVPKRKRRKRQVPKVLLYSATVLTVTSTNVLPAVSVFAESQTPTKQNEQDNSELLQQEPLAQNQDDSNEPAQSEEASSEQTANYTVIYKDENGKIININDHFSSEAGNDVSTLIANDVTKLTGNWELIDPTSSIITPVSSKTPIEVTLKQQDQPNAEQEAPETPASSNQQVEQNEAESIQEKDETPIAASASESQETKVETPAPENNQLQSQNITPKAAVSNKIAIVLNGATLETITVSGEEGSSINLNSWIPSGYALTDDYKFKADNTNQTVEILKVDDPSFVKNTIQIKDSNGTPIGAAFDVYGVVGQKINFGIFLADGYDPIDNNTVFDYSQGVRDISVKVSSSPNSQRVTNEVQFTIDGTNVGNTVEINGRLDDEMNLSQWIPSGYKTTTTPHFNDGISTQKIALEKISNASFKKNTIQFKNGNANVGSSFDVFGTSGDSINFGIFMPEGYNIPSVTFDESTSTRDISLTGNNQVTNILSFKENGNVVSTIPISGKKGTTLDITRLLPENYEIVNSGDNVVTFDDAVLNKDINIQGKIIPKNSILFVDDTTQAIVGSQEVANARYNSAITLNLPTNYLLKNDKATFAVGADQSTISVPVKKDQNHIDNYVQFKVDGNNFGEKIKVTGKLNDTITFNNNEIPSGYELDGTAPVFAADGSTVEVNLKKSAVAGNIENTVEFQDQNNTTVGGPYTVSGAKDAAINLASLIPAGYELVGTAPIFNDTNTSHIVKVKLSTPAAVTNYVQFTIDGQDQGEMHEVSGNPGSKINLSSLIPTGYELVNPTPTPTIDPNKGTIIRVAIMKAGVSVTNHVQFKIDNNNIGSAVDVTGKQGNNMNLSQYIPSGYKIVGTPVLAADNTTVDVTLQVADATAPKNTIQFVNNGVNVGSAFDVYGQNGATIQLGIFAQSYAGPALKIDTTKSSRQIDFTSGLDIVAPVSVTNHVQFKLNGNNVGAAVDVTGNQDDNMTLTQYIPSGYKIVGTPVLAADNSTVDVTLQVVNSTAPKNTIQFVDNNGANVGAPFDVYEANGAAIKVGIFTPAGKTAPSFNFDSSKTDRKININDGTDVTASVHVKNTVQFVLDGDSINSPVEVEGNSGESVNLTDLIPTGYELQSTPVYGPEGTALSAVLQKKTDPSLIKNTFTFNTLTRAQIGSAVDVYGAENETINFGIFMPNGYELSDTAPSIINSSQPRSINVRLRGGSPITTVTNHVQFKLNGNNVGSAVDVTGNQGDNMTLTQYIPSGYSIQGTPTLAADNTTVDVTLQVADATAPKNTIQFVNNGVNVGSAFDVYGQNGATIQLGIFAQSYAGPALKIDTTKTSRQIDFNSGLDIVAPISVTNHVQFKLNGNNVGAPVDVTGNQDDNMNLSQYIPSGYSIQGTPTLAADNTTVDVTLQVVNANASKNTIQFVDNNGANVGDPFAVYANDGDPIKLGIFAPAGFTVPSFNFDASKTDREIDVTTGQDITAPNSVTNHVQFKIDGNNIGDPIDITGNVNDTMNLNNYIPSGYKISTMPTIVADGSNIDVTLEVINSSAAKNTIQFVNNGANVGNPFDVYANNGDPIKLGIFAPNGFTVPSFNFDDSKTNREIDVNSGQDVVAPVSVTNHVQFKLNGNNIGAPVDVTGNQDDNMNLSQYIPSGYSIQGTPTLAADNTTVDVTLQVADATAPKNTIQFVNNGVNVGSAFDVYGQNGATIQLGIFAQSYAGPALKIDTTKTSRQIDFNSGLDIVAPVSVTNHVQFKVNGNNIGAPVDVTGSQGDNMTLTQYIPSGYSIQGTPTLAADNTTVDVTLQVADATAPKNTIQFVNNGVNVGSAFDVYGQNGVAIQLGIFAQGYAGPTLQIDTTKTNRQIDFTSGQDITTPNSVTNHIQFKINGVSVGAPVNITGAVGDNMNLSQYIPSGYNVVGTPQLGADNSNVDVSLQVADATVPKNTIQFVSNGANVGNAFDVYGQNGDVINLGIFKGSYAGPDLRIDSTKTNRQIDFSSGQDVVAPVSVTNHVQFKLNGNNIGAPVDVTGNQDDNMNLNQYIPSGYSIQGTPTLAADNTTVDVTLQVADATAPKNTIQFVNNGVNVGSAFDVYGQNGTTIQLGIFAQSYAGPALKIDTTKTNRQIDFNSGLDIVPSPVQVTKTVKFTDPDNNVLKEETVTGAKDSTKDISSLVPDNYELVNATDKDITLTDDGQAIVLQVQGKEYNNTISFVDETTQQNLGSQSVHGRYNTAITDSLQVPTGYKLQNPGIASTLKFGASNAEIKVSVVKDENHVTNQIQFTVDGANHGAPVEVSGNLNDVVDIASLMPNGYELSDPSLVVKLVANGTTQTVAIKQSTPAPNSVTNTIKFQTADGVQVGQSVTVTGLTNDIINLSSMIPTGYELVDPSAVHKIGAADETITINIKKISTAVDNYIQFTVNGTDFGSMIKVNGEPGSNINVASHLPAGYELVDPAAIVKVDSSNGKIVKIAIKKTAVAVTNTVKITDPEGNVLTHQDFTGNLDDTQDISSLLPENYEWINNSDKTVTLGTNGHVITVQVQGKEYHNELNFIDDEKQTLVGKQDITGRFNTMIDTSSLNIPAGYKLKISMSRGASGVRIGVNDAKVTVHVERDATQVSNQIQFTVNGTNLGAPATVTGKVGDPISLTSLIPNGYELVTPNSSLTFAADGTTQTVALKKKTASVNDVTNTIKFQLADGTAVGTPLTVTGQTNDVINLATMIPAGYELVNKSDVHKIGAADATLTITVQKISTAVDNYVQFTVNGTDFGTMITVNGEPNSTIDLSNKIPAGYELVDKTTHLKIDATNGKIIKVAIKGVAVKNTVNITINGQQVGSVSVSGNQFDNIDLSSFLPSGYEVASTPTLNADGTVQNVAIQKKNDSTLIEYKVNLTSTDGSINKEVKLYGKPGDPVKLGIFVPTGYTAPTNAKFGAAGVPLPIQLTKSGTPAPTMGTNYLQFTVDGVNYGDQVKVTGTIGSAIKISDFIPSGYELVDKNASASIDSSATVYKIAIKKTNAPIATTNYVQFTVNGINYGAAIKVSGNIDDVINLTSLIPSGYELATTPTTIKFGLEGTTHRVELKQTTNTQTVENYLQFTIDGQDYSIRIARTGKLGDKLDPTPWIPAGYELVDKTTPLQFQANGTVQRIALQKSTTPAKTTVTNWIQLTMDGTALGSPIKVTGTTGNPITLSSVIPAGYELVNKATTMNFGSDGDVYQVAVKKSITPTPALSTVQNYIQFTVDGKDFSSQILRTGKLGDVIDVASLVPAGYTLADKNLTYRFVEDGTIQRIALQKLAGATDPASSFNAKKAADPASKTYSDPADPASSTTRKQASLPQTGSDEIQAAALSALGVTTAGAAALWFSSRRKRLQKIRSIEHSGK